MKISHEVPLCLLEESRSFNDYDYALVHLFKKFPKYLEFYKESLRQNRIVYLDNSLFELETPFNSDEFAKWCTELGSINPKNFYYIVPDSLEDYEFTKKNFQSFQYDIPGNKIGVVQGKTPEEVLECFMFMKDNADVVALSFDYSFWGKNLEKAMMERVKLVHDLKNRGLLENVKIHLLGCYLPQEASYYKDVPEIFSMDTSNPIVHGLSKIRYNNGLNIKVKTKLADLITVEKVPEDVYYNIKEFRKFVGT